MRRLWLLKSEILLEKIVHLFDGMMRAAALYPTVAPSVSA
jgi:hypothetical protein